MHCEAEALNKNKCMCGLGFGDDLPRTCSQVEIRTSVTTRVKAVKLTS
jgi:hypothetical protein